MNRAAGAMRTHLENVERNLLKPRPAPDAVMADLREAPAA
jgi:hypothetical protein